MDYCIYYHWLSEHKTGLHTICESKRPSKNECSFYPGCCRWSEAFGFCLPVESWADENGIFDGQYCLIGAAVGKVDPSDICSMIP